MKKIFSSRRGVSPLIATVLLIAFAVALGAVVMNWSRSFTGEQIENTNQVAGTSSACEFNVRMQLVEIGGIERICYGNESGKFIIKNIGNTEIEGVQVQVIGSQSVADATVSGIGSTIGKGKVAMGNFSWNNSIGDFEQVIISPIIKVNGVNVTCTGQGREIIRTASEMDNCNW
ncbi:MAG: archaellin/type IV pilin N-terminal domain-containing protein [Candidatus Woesearchaeota archaeon]